MLTYEDPIRRQVREAKQQFYYGGRVTQFHNIKQGCLYK